MRLELSLVLFFTIIHLQLHVSGKENVESVPDLEKSMYMTVDGYPCVRLLNLSGEIGCANPGRDKVVAPIIRFNEQQQLLQSSTVLVSINKMQSFFTRLSTDTDFGNKVVGVLVESGTELERFSPAEKFPQAKFAPYGNLNYEWNPIGSDIMWKAYDFPIFLMSNRSTLALQEVAIRNEKNMQSSSLDVAEFEMVMQTTKSGTRDSESCLREQTCLPLGGYSVWSSLPPINISTPELAKPIILTIASMDSASFFRDRTFGADSPISGLISLLAAADALSRVDGLNGMSKQLVFLVCTGEAWGFLGSRRFLHELDQQSDGVIGLNGTLIETVMEIGSVGKGFSNGVTTFYAHTAGASSTQNMTLSALQRAQDSLKSENIHISTASNSNPGIPPSSLMAFLRQNPQTSGIVLEDFDTVFSNKFYHSHLDNISNINSSAIVSAASLVARTLYTLANDKKELSTSTLSSLTVNASLVEDLLSCLLSCDPGLSCDLIKKYISPSSTTICPSHYVGVIPGEPSPTPYLGDVGDVSRFVWNFLADRTSLPVKNATSDCSKGCGNSDSGQVCIKAETGAKGVCVISTTRYVPAYSTRLKFESGKWNVIAPNSSDPMGMVDPVWTESNWDALELRVYTVQGATYDRLVLLGGIGITFLAYIAIISTRAFINKTLKHD